jgi:hypothetical protein
MFRSGSSSSTAKPVSWRSTQELLSWELLLLLSLLLLLLLLGLSLGSWLRTHSTAFILFQPGRDVFVARPTAGLEEEKTTFLLSLLLK